MQVNIKNLIDDAQCYDTVRNLRWASSIECPFCESKIIIKKGFDDKERFRHRYGAKTAADVLTILQRLFFQDIINL